MSVNCDSDEFKALEKQERQLRAKLKGMKERKDSLYLAERQLSDLKTKVAAKPTSRAEAEARKVYRESNPLKESIRNATKNVGQPEVMAEAAIANLRRADLDDINPYYDTIDEMLEDTLGIRLHESTLQSVAKESRKLLRSTQERLRAIIVNNKQFQVTDEGQLQDIAQKLTTHLEANEMGWLKQMDDQAVDGFSFSFDELTGSSRVTFNMTQKDGNLFNSWTEANFAAMKFREASNLKGLDMEVVKHNDQFVIQAKRTLGDEELSTGVFKDLKTRQTNWVGRTLKDHKSQVDEELGQSGLLGTLERERLSASLTRELNDAINPLSRKQQKDLEAVLEDTRMSGTWMEPSRLKEAYILHAKRPPVRAEINAYYTMQLMEDTINYSRNVGRWSELDSAGFKTITLQDTTVRTVSRNGRDFPEKGDINVTARVVDDDSIPSNIEDYGVFDITGRNLMYSNKAELDKLLSQGYKLLEVEDSAKLNKLIEDDVEHVKYVMVAPKRFKENALAFQQIQPRAGGFKNFEGVTHFVTANPVTSLASGKRVVTKPSVIRGAKNRKQAEQYVAKVNAGLKLLRQLNPTGKGLTWRDVSPAQIDEVNKQIRAMDIEGVGDMVAFRDYILRNGIDLNGGLTTTRRSSLIQPKYFDKEGNEVESLNTFLGQDEALQQAHLGRTQGGLIMTDGTDAVATSPIRAMQQQLDRAVTAQSFREFKTNQVNRFKATFKNFMADPTADALEMATKGAMRDAQSIDEGARLLGMSPEQLKSTIKSHQNYINQVLRTDNTMDAMTKNFMYGFAEAVESSEWLAKYAAKGQDRLSSFLYRQAEVNPIDRLRSFTFNAKLGMFSPVQFLQQAQGAALAFAMSPKYGFQAASTYPAMRMAIRMGDVEGIKHIAEKTYKLAGFKNADEFTDMVVAFQRSGYADFSTGIALGDSGFDNAAKGYVGRQVDRIASAGRKPFEEGEMISRITGYNIAYRRWINNDLGVNPKGLGADSPEARKFLSAETDKLLFSPLAENNPLFTKGWGSIPFQFWSHNAKVLNAMLPTKLGGNSRYTWQEKASIAIGGSLFYGTTHVPLATGTINFFLDEAGVNLEPEAAKQIHDGLFDTLMYVASDGKIDSEAGVRWGAWSMVDSMIDRYIRGEATGGDYAEFILGATGSTLRSSLIEPFKVMNTLSAWTHPSLDKITLAGITALGGTFASAGMAQRVYLAQKYNLLFDKQYGAASPITGEEAWFMLFTGAQPSASNQMFRDIGLSKARSMNMEDDMKIVHMLMNKSFRSGEEEAEMYRQALSLYAIGLGNGKYAQDVMALALQRISKGGTLSEAMRSDQLMNNEVRPALQEAKMRNR